MCAPSTPWSPPTCCIRFVEPSSLLAFDAPVCHAPPLPHPVHQIIDSGLDETSCYFADGDGEEVTHGHYFDELSESHSSVSLPAYTIFEGGDFSFDPSRRKVARHRA